MYTEYLYGDSLAHYGTLGQKWGYRRFQNPDGSLTPAGKARYAKYNARIEKKKAEKEYVQGRFDKAISKREQIRDQRVENKKHDKGRADQLFDKAIEKRSNDPDRAKRKQAEKERADKRFDKAIEKRQREGDLRVETKKHEKEQSAKLYDKAIKNRERWRDEGFNSHEKALVIGATAAAVTAGKIFVNYQIADAIMGGQLKATPQTFTETAVKAGRNAVIAYAATRVLDNTFDKDSKKK